MIIFLILGLIFVALFALSLFRWSPSSRAVTVFKYVVLVIVGFFTCLFLHLFFTGNPDVKVDLFSERLSVISEDGLESPTSFHRYQDAIYVVSSDYHVRQRNFIGGADASTFTMLSKWYAKDMNNAYFARGTAASAIEEVDLETFEATPVPGYAKDKNAVYWEGEVIDGSDPNSFRFTEHTNDVGRTHVYVGDDGGTYIDAIFETVLIPELSIDSYERVGPHFGKDSDTVVTWTHDTPYYRVIEGADLQTFASVPYDYCKDAEEEEGEWERAAAKDKSAVYDTFGNVIEGANPEDC